MGILRNIFLFFGLFVLIGHSVVPHSHHAPQDCCEEIHQSQSASIFDILLHILEEDLGEGHLEDIALNELPAFDAGLRAEPDVIYAPICECAEMAVVPEGLPVASLQSLRSPRAPPIA